MTKRIKTITISEDHRDALQKEIDKIDVENETLSVTLKTPENKIPGYTDYGLFDIAFHNSCVDCIVLDKETVSLENLDKLEKAILLVKYASSANSLIESKIKVAQIIADRWQISFFEDDFAELLEKSDGETVAKARQFVEKREQKIKGYHSTSYSAETVPTYNSVKIDLESESKQVIFLTEGMGGRKTEKAREIYSEAAELGLFPIMITGSRTVASNFHSADHVDHYRSDSKDSDKRGLIGVVNSIASPRYEEMRKRCKVLIIDEVELTMTHMASEAFGKTYRERVAKAEIIKDLIKSSQVVVGADAMLTDHTIEHFYSINKTPARIIKTDNSKNTSNKLFMYLKKESELISKMIEDAKSGQKVAAFCDYNVEEFSEIAESLEKSTGKKVVPVTAAYLEETNQSLGDIKEILNDADIALISPVINAGASIVDERYKSVYVLSGFTLGSNELLQATRRFRCADTVYLSFKRGKPCGRVVDPRSIIHQTLLRHTEFPFDDALSLYDTESGKFLADHTVLKNRQFENFRQNLIISAQQIGFEVIREEADIAEIQKGREAKKAGRVSNEQISEEAVKEASDLFKDGRVDEIDFGKKDAQTYAQQQAERAVKAFGILQIPEISEESYLEIFKLDIDKIVLTRKVLSKHISLNSETTRMDIAADVASKFLTDSGVDFDNLKASEITKEKADEAFENLLDPVALENGNPSTGLSLIGLVFPGVNLK